MQEAVKKRSFALGGFLLFPLLLYIVIFGMKRLMGGMQEGLALCARALIPGIFPFLIISDLLISLSATKRFLYLCGIPFSKILRVSPYGASAFLMGSLFGFPIGAKAVVSYYREGLISREEGERLLLYSGNANPFFLIGSVGGSMFASQALGVRLFISEICISLMCGVLLGLRRKKAFLPKVALIIRETKFSLTNSIRKAVTQTLYICGYVTFFSALFSVASPLFTKDFLNKLLASLLELSTATANAAKNLTALSIPVCAFAVSFSGLSVFLQTKDVTEDTDLSLKYYFPVKILCGSVAFFIAKAFPF